MISHKIPDRLFDFANCIFMIIVFIIMFYPFLYVFEYSVSNPALLTGGLLIIPKGFTLSSYLVLLTRGDVLSGLTISIARTVMGPFGMLFVTAMAAYVITKDYLIGIKFFRKFFVFTMYVSGGIIPSYVLMKSLHLTNNFFVYILPVLLSAFNLILIKTYIEDLPKSLEESAIIDGANEATVFFRIIFPLCTPILAAVCLFAAIGQWNSFIDTQLYNSMNRNLYTLQYVLYNYLAAITLSLDQAKNNDKGLIATPESLKMAITAITMIPILIIYPFIQKYFISGLLIGAVKG
ncbi:MAG: hypothetical protein A2Y21_04180 [Clostridiales bacterium GWC2_40_7]|nr:MAG: hypothetical protein A2Y21_04180 [Clostridiales bacterium GWC2_40_7]